MMALQIQRQTFLLYKLFISIWHLLIHVRHIYTIEQPKREMIINTNCACATLFTCRIFRHVQRLAILSRQNKAFLFWEIEMIIDSPVAFSINECKTVKKSHLCQKKNREINLFGILFQSNNLLLKSVKLA